MRFRPRARALLVALASASLAACGAHGPVAIAPVTGGAAAPCRTLQRDGAPPAPLDWLTIADPRESRRLDLWCRSVGPAVLQHGAAPERPGDSLALVSWNTHVGAARLSALIRDLRTGVLSAGQPVTQFALLLQEAYRADATLPPIPPGVDAPGRIAARVREEVSAVARREHLWLYYVPSMRNGAPDARGTPALEDRGNAILSSLPLDDVAAVELPMAAQRRAAAIATVRVGAAAARLRLVSAHFDSTVGAGRLWIIGAPAHRARQAAALAQALSSGPDAATPTVVGADLNTWNGPSEGAYTTLRDAFPQTPLPSGVARFPFLRRRVDFLFFGIPAGWAHGYTVIADRKYGSDHRPVLGWVRVTGG